jgi:HlyD family secretion protein
MRNYQTVAEVIGRLMQERPIATFPRSAYLIPPGTSQRDPTQADLHAATAAEFLPPIRWWTTLGGLVLLVTFAAAIILASVLTYKVTVKAPATVRPTGKLRIVESAAEGTVKSVEVVENQDVKEGDGIAFIDDARLQTTKRQLQGNIEQARQQLRQIRAQLQAIDWQIAAETDLLNRTLTAAEAELSLKQRDYRDKRITTTAEVHEAEAAFEFARDGLVRYRGLVKKGAISELEIKEKETALKTAEARLERVKAARSPSSAEITMAKEKIRQEHARGEVALARLRQEREQLIQQQVELQNQLSRDDDELQQIVTDIEHTIIRAPTSGIIQELALRNKGQVVRLGKTVAQIAPRDAPLEIQAVVVARDIGKIALGHPVHMRVSACPYPDYGTLKGTVSAISPDAIFPQGEETAIPSRGRETAERAAYKVTIQPARLTLRALGRECALYSGMEGRAEIVSREETALQFLLRKAKLMADW